VLSFLLKKELESARNDLTEKLRRKQEELDNFKTQIENISNSHKELETSNRNLNDLVNELKVKSENLEQR